MGDGTVHLVEEFEALRPRLFGLAYRLLGEAGDAEDAVQDAFLRWRAADRATITHPGAWLAKVLTNLCLNRLESARARRERYVGPWLPEPVLTSDGTLAQPSELAERGDSVSLALLVAMERLTPTERAVFVLRSAFDHSYREIAQILELSEEHCRQLQRRARVRISAAQRRFEPDRAQWRRLVERFMRAAREGDVGALEDLLAADAVSWTDGGGKTTAARRPVHGRGRIARMVAGWVRILRGRVDAVRIDEVNGEPALLGLSGDALLGVMILDIADGRVRALRSVTNPDKLEFLSRQIAGLSRSAAPSGS